MMKINQGLGINLALAIFWNFSTPSKWTLKGYWPFVTMRQFELAFRNCRLVQRGWMWFNDVNVPSSNSFFDMDFNYQFFLCTYLKMIHRCVPVTELKILRSVIFTELKKNTLTWKIDSTASEIVYVFKKKMSIFLNVDQFYTK